ncbi:unnamed protein product [Parnassius apollo]|uniref:(apollo) hypothetical protein n=1 Tax=Parnassius apollo TaxID=110799 RepID=A0A8S3WQK8_PARAO|nr:unnamed protein product [Parnassius apollo]
MRWTDQVRAAVDVPLHECTRKAAVREECSVESVPQHPSDDHDRSVKSVSTEKKKEEDYLASSNDRHMREKMKERYKLQKVHAKTLIEEVRERCRIEADERLSHNFKENSKLFWKEVEGSRSGATALRMNKSKSAFENQ